VKSFTSKQQQSGGYYDSQVLDTSSQGMSWGPGSQRTRPKRWDIFLHIAKTLRLIRALMTDRRVSLWRKALFLGSIAGLLIILLFPDALNEAVLSTVLPLAGTVLGVPLDAGFDWMAFAFAVVTLFHFFPAELVAEHYRRIFGR
jgi:hypothetical protein